MNQHKNKDVCHELPCKGKKKTRIALFFFTQQLVEQSNNNSVGGSPMHRWSPSCKQMLINYTLDFLKLCVCWSAPEVCVYEAIDCIGAERFGVLAVQDF